MLDNFGNLLVPQTNTFYMAQKIDLSFLVVHDTVGDNP